MINDDDLMSRFNDLELIKTRKVPICLVLDISGSMAFRDGATLTKIELLNEFYKGFFSYVRSDRRAKAMVDLSIITFGDEVIVVNEWSNIESIKETSFLARGTKPIGAAMKKALNLIESRTIYYKDEGFEYYKPIIILMTDGEATADYKESAQVVSNKVKLKIGGIRVLPIIIGQNLYSKTIAAFSPIYKPKVFFSFDEFIDDLKFILVGFALS